jgi:hypothetical protein
MRAVPTVSENDKPTADILDWCGPFAARVMARIHEYDDGWPKPQYANTVILLDARQARIKARRSGPLAAVRSEQSPK